MPDVVRFSVVALIAGLSISASSQILNQPPVPEWIEHPSGSSNQPIFFRKTFEAELPMLKAILLGACQGQMKIYVNGQPVGEIAGAAKAASLDLTAHVRHGQNVLAIQSANPAGKTAFSLLLELNGDFARKHWVFSDSTWLASANETPNWKLPNFSTNGWLPARSIGRVNAVSQANPFDPKIAFDAYDSWKLALGTNTATDPNTFTLQPGFETQLLRSARPEEGSWIAMAFDP